MNNTVSIYARKLSEMLKTETVYERLFAPSRILDQFGRPFQRNTGKGVKVEFSKVKIGNVPNLGCLSGGGA